jgi:hypothetical protein
MASINVKPWRGGYRKGKRKNKGSQRMQGVVMRQADYFADNTTRIPKDFLLRFRMEKKLTMKIVYSMWKYDEYFNCKKDYTELPGFTSVKKWMAALRCLAYATSPYT